MHPGRSPRDADTARRPAPAPAAPLRSGGGSAGGARGPSPEAPRQAGLSLRADLAASAPAQRLRRGLEAGETFLLVVLLAVMIGVAVYQIAARNLFGGGLVWGEDLVQVAMLWATMIGAAAAAGSNTHIRIDVVARFGGPRLRAVVDRVTALFTAVSCAALGWYSIEFIRWDFIDRTVGFGAVPAWVCESIIPIAAAVMAVRYLLRTLWPEPGSAPGSDAQAARKPALGPDPGRGPRPEAGG